LNTSNIISQRLQNQELSSPTFASAADVVRQFGAVQAQDFAGAKWALALRTVGMTNDDVEQAFNRGEILRTHLLRPTWHFVVPEDIRWLLQLTGPRVNAKCGSAYRRFELDEPLLKRSNRTIVKALKGGKHLTRAELKSALDRAGIVADDTVRLAHILIRAELDGVVCSGPRRGKQFTYALLEERVPATKALTRDESLAELTRRYFSSHGPATLADYVWWSGLTVNDAKHGIAMIESDLNSDGVYWSAAASTSPSVKRSAHLLPAFDEYTVAYKDRELLLDRTEGISTFTNSDAIGPRVIVDGKIAGAWKAAPDNGSLNIALTSCKTLNTRDQRLIRQAAERYATFLSFPSAFVASS
jgi:hypothetical protein